MLTRKWDYLVICFAGFAMTFSNGMTNPILPLYAAGFTSSLLLIGVVVSGYLMLRPFCEIPVGRLSDTIGRRIPAIIGLLLSLAGALLCAFSGDVIQLVAGRIIWGIGTSFFVCTMLAYVSDIFSKGGMGKALGTFQSIEFSGGIFGASLGGYITTIIGYRGLFLTLATIILTSLILFVALGRLGESGQRQEQQLQQSSRDTAMKIIKTPIIILASYCAFTMSFKERGLILTIIPLYVNLEIGIPIVELGLLMSGRGIGMAIGTISGGWLSDKIGRRIVLLSGLSITTLSTLIFLWAPGFLSLLAVMVLNGIAVGITITTIIAMVADAFPAETRGMAIGTYRTFQHIAGILGPIILTAIVGSQGFSYSFYMMAFVMLLTILVYVVFQIHSSH